MQAKRSERKAWQYVLTGLGFSEILTNSITNSKYASETEELQQTVKPAEQPEHRIGRDAAEHAVHRPGSASVQQQPQSHGPPAF
jgi:hypothetical protein